MLFFITRSDFVNSSHSEEWIRLPYTPVTITGRRQQQRGNSEQFCVNISQACALLFSKNSMAHAGTDNFDVNLACWKTISTTRKMVKPVNPGVMGAVAFGFHKTYGDTDETIPSLLGRVPVLRLSTFRHPMMMLPLACQSLPFTSFSPWSFIRPETLRARRQFHSPDICHVIAVDLPLEGITLETVFNKTQTGVCFWENHRLPFNSNSPTTGGWKELSLTHGGAASFVWLSQQSVFLDTAINTMQLDVDFWCYKSREWQALNQKEATTAKSTILPALDKLLTSQKNRWHFAVDFWEHALFELGRVAGWHFFEKGFDWQHDRCALLLEQGR